MKISLKPEILGVVALGLWSTSATIFMAIKGLPGFQLLAMMFLGSFICGLAITALNNSWGEIRKISLTSIIALFGGVVGQQIIYLCALQYAPPAEVDIIAYLWPVISVMLSALFLGARLSPLQLIGLSMGFAAVILIGHEKFGLGGIKLGHYLAVLSAICWSLYSTFIRKLTQVNAAQLSIAYGLGFLLMLPCHLLFEPFIWPTTVQWAAIAYLCILPAFVGYILWTHAMQFGKVNSITIIAYAKPIASVALLWACGFAESSWTLGLAVILVFFAGVFSLERSLNFSLRYYTRST